MYYFWSLQVIGDLFLIMDDNLVSGVSKHLETIVTLCDNVSDITSNSEDGYYCLFDNELLNIYKKTTNVGYIWNSHDLVHIGIAGSVKSKNKPTINNKQWLFVEELNNILLKDTTVSQLKPSQMK